MRAAVVVALVTGVAAKQLSLTWKDCNPKSHAPIQDFGPAEITLGQKTTMTGHGKLDEDVTNARFDLKMTGFAGVTLLHCSGDASTSKTCRLPMGVGSLTFNAMTFPIAKGTVPVNVDIDLHQGLPSSLTNTHTTARATDQSGEELFCIEIASASELDIPEDAVQVAEPVSVGSTVAAGRELALTWSDCNPKSHAPISDFGPTKITLGQKTTMIGHGDLDEEVTRANFDLQMKGFGGITLLHCHGDASQSKTCRLPMNTGSLTFNAMTFPIAKGTVPVKVDIDLLSGLPPQLARTTVTSRATDQNGQELFCIEIKSTPASEAAVMV